jgi:hypothetical protein
MIQPVRLSSQFFYSSKENAITELKDVFFYVNIKGAEPVAFDKDGYLIEKRKTKSVSKLLVNEDIRLSPCPVVDNLMAVYLVDKDGLEIERNAKISKCLRLIRDSKRLKVD